MPEPACRVLEPGDPFRDWLVAVAGRRVRDMDCRVREIPMSPASHVVCKYAFDGGRSAVVAKFFGRPTGNNHSYDAVRAMENEYRLLGAASGAIRSNRPVGMSEEFDCVLVTEFVRGTSLQRLLRRKKKLRLKQRLARIAEIQRRLHDRTVQSYNKEREFAAFHGVLDDLRLSSRTRDRFDRQLGKWWYSPLLDRKTGCMIHRDATPANYLFSGDRVAAVDFESSWEGAHPIHDLGILCAEITHHFDYYEKDRSRARPYTDHYLLTYCTGKKELLAVMRVLPFYTALGFLRIARLYDGSSYRDNLIREAMECLHSRV